MNLQTLQAQLSQLERKRQQLEKRIKQRASKQYASLPAKLGLKNIDALIIELLPYGSSSLRSRLSQNGNGNGAAHASNGAAAVSAPTNGLTVNGKRRGRPPKNAPKDATPKSEAKSSRGTRYTAEVKAAVKKAVEAGGKTVEQISRELGPSVFSIKDWKKQWGLTRARKKK